VNVTHPSFDPRNKVRLIGESFLRPGFETVLFGGLSSRA
jgi:hypothetical protein